MLQCYNFLWMWLWPRWLWPTAGPRCPKVPTLGRARAKLFPGIGRMARRSRRRGGKRRRRKKKFARASAGGVRVSAGCGASCYRRDVGVVRDI